MSYVEAIGASYILPARDLTIAFYIPFEMCQVQRLFLSLVEIYSSLVKIYVQRKHIKLSLLFLTNYST